MAKPFHAGHGARNGVVAAVLAADGFSANPNVFDTGFFEAFYRAHLSNDWQLAMSLGNPYHIINRGIGIKMYPSDGYLPLTFEFTLELVQQHKISVADVISITKRSAPGQFRSAGGTR